MFDLASLICSLISISLSTALAPNLSFNFSFNSDISLFASLTCYSYSRGFYFCWLFSYSSYSSFLSKFAKFLSQVSKFFLSSYAVFGSSPYDNNFLMACWSLIILSLACLIWSNTSFLKGSYLRKLLKSSIYPQSMTTTEYLGLLFLSIGTLAIFFTISIPSITCPNTTCFPSKWGQAFKVMKNWDALVFLPLFAIESNPAHEWVLAKL